MCACVLTLRPSLAGTKPTAAASDLLSWQADGVCLLLHYDPAAGVGGLLAGNIHSPNNQQVQACTSGGPLTGYRQPRDSRRGRAPPAAWLLNAPSQPLHHHRHHGGLVGQKRPLPRH